MAYIRNRSFVDDGSNDLTVAGDAQFGTVSSIGPITSSGGSFGELLTIGNFGPGQTLGTPNTWYQINQWLTSSLSSPGIVVGNNGMTGSVSGLFWHSVAISFSGSAGVYTIAMFSNGRQDNTLQTTIETGQSRPSTITITDLDFHSPADIPAIHDVRVKCNNAGANFQMNYGAFSVVRVVG